MEPQRHRTAVIGLGKKGFLYDIDDELRTKPQSHVGAYLTSNETELIAVADDDPAKMDRFKKVYSWIPAFSDFEKMLDVCRPEILSIATPTETHWEIVRAAARHDGLRVIFVEKPIASTIEEAQKMVKACAQHNVMLVVNHERRWHPTWTEASDLLNKIAPLRVLIGYCSGDPLEAGIHMADLFLWLGKGVEHHYVDLMGARPYDPYLVFELVVFGEKGRMTISDNGRSSSLYMIAPSDRYSGISELAKAREQTYTESRPLLKAVHHLVAIIDCLERPCPSGLDGLHALELALEWKDNGTSK